MRNCFFWILIDENWRSRNNRFCHLQVFLRSRNIRFCHLQVSLRDICIIFKVTTTYFIIITVIDYQKCRIEFDNYVIPKLNMILDFKSSCVFTIVTQRKNKWLRIVMPPELGFVKFLGEISSKLFSSTVLDSK